MEREPKKARLLFSPIASSGEAYNRLVLKATR
jgi:hypothetical protein